MESKGRKPLQVGIFTQFEEPREKMILNCSNSNKLNITRKMDFIQKWYQEEQGNSNITLIFFQLHQKERHMHRIK
jgi:hypothetical protein